jgi:hypothetical protein
MKPHAIPWPKIIATVIAGLGVSGVFSAWSTTWTAQRIWITCDWQVMAISAVLLAFSYPLARSREWARRVLLIAVVLIGASLTLWDAVKVVSPMSFSDLTPEQIEVVRLWQRLQDLSSFFVVLAIALFVALFLSHQNVVASFQRHHNAPAKV